MRTMTDEERAAAIARVVFLMPGLTASGLRAVRETAEFWAAGDPRDLSSGTLAAEQATRHGLLADADAVLSKARRERTHGASCDCGACAGHTDTTTPGYEWRVTGEAEGPPGFGTLPILDLVPVARAADLHDTASDAAAVIGAERAVDLSLVDGVTVVSRSPFVVARGGAADVGGASAPLVRGQVKP